MNFLSLYKNFIITNIKQVSARAYLWSDFVFKSDITGLTNSFSITTNSCGNTGLYSTATTSTSQPASNSTLVSFWAHIARRNRDTSGIYNSSTLNNAVLCDKNRFLITGQTQIGNPLKELQLSPWPVLLSTFLGNGALILIGLFNGIVYKDIYLYFSLVLVFFSIISWLMDVSREGTFLGNHISIVRSSLYHGLGLFIVSEIMFFFSLFWAFFNSVLSGSVWVGCSWPPVGLNTYLQNAGLELAVVNTCILLFSGYTLTLAHEFYIYKNKFLSTYFLTATILLGIFFMFVQVFEFKNSLYCFNDAVYSSIFFFLTGFHGLHVILGIKGLIFSAYRSILDYTRADQHLGFEAAIWYWHFVDVVWLFVFSLIYVWGNASTTSLVCQDVVYYNASNRVIPILALCSVFLFLFFYPNNYLKRFISFYKLNTYGLTTLFYFCKDKFIAKLQNINFLNMRQSVNMSTKLDSVPTISTKNADSVNTLLRKNSPITFVIAMLVANALTADVPVVNPYLQTKLQDSATLVSFASKHFFLSMYILTVFVVSFVLFITLFFVYSHEDDASRKKFVQAPQKTHNTFLETIWTTLPSGTISTLAASSFILLFISDVGNSFRFYGDIISNKFPATLRTRVTGSQWFWTYNYDLPKFTELADANSKVSHTLEQVMRAVTSILPGEHRLLSTGDNLVLPTFTLLRFYITSTDVIHSFALPSMYIKLDACPGRLNLLSTVVTRVGAFYGQCSEICGINHSFMPISTEIVDSKSFWSGVTNFIKEQYSFLAGGVYNSVKDDSSVAEEDKTSAFLDGLESVVAVNNSNFFDNQIAPVIPLRGFIAPERALSLFSGVGSNSTESSSTASVTAVNNASSNNNDSLVFGTFIKKKYNQNPTNNLISSNKGGNLSSIVGNSVSRSSMGTDLGFFDIMLGKYYDKSNIRFGAHKLDRQRYAYLRKYDIASIPDMVPASFSAREEFIKADHTWLSLNSITKLFGFASKDFYPSYDFTNYLEEDINNTGQRSLSDSGVLTSLGRFLGLHQKTETRNAKIQMLSDGVIYAFFLNGYDSAYRLNTNITIKSENKLIAENKTFYEYLFGWSWRQGFVATSWQDVLWGGIKEQNYWSNIPSYFKLNFNDLLILADEYNKVKEFFDALSYYHRTKDYCNAPKHLRAGRPPMVEPKLIDYLGSRTFYNPFAYYTPTPEDFTGNLATWILPKSYPYILHLKLFLEHNPNFMKIQLQFQHLLDQFLIFLSNYSEDSNILPTIHEIIPKTRAQRLIDWLVCPFGLELPPTFKEITRSNLDLWYDYYGFRPYLDANFDIVAASPRNYYNFFNSEYAHADFIVNPLFTRVADSSAAGGYLYHWNINFGTLFYDFFTSVLYLITNFYADVLHEIENYEIEATAYKKALNLDSGNVLIITGAGYFIPVNLDENPPVPYMYWKNGSFLPHQLFAVLSFNELYVDFIRTCQLFFKKNSNPCITFYNDNIHWIFERPDKALVSIDESAINRKGVTKWGISNYISNFLKYCQEYKNNYLYVTFYDVSYDEYYYWRTIPHDDGFGGGCAEPFEFFFSALTSWELQPAGVDFMYKTARSELYSLFDVYVNNNNLNFTQRLAQFFYGSSFPAHLLYKTRYGVNKVFILDIFKSNLELRNELLGAKRTVNYEEPVTQYKGLPKDQYTYRTAAASWATHKTHSATRRGAAASIFEIGYFRFVWKMKSLLQQVIFKRLFSGWVYLHLIDKGALWIWSHCGFSIFYKYLNKFHHVKGEVYWFLYTNYFPAFMQKTYLNKFLNARTTSYKNAYPLLSTRLYLEQKVEAVNRCGSWNYGGHLWYAKKYDKTYYFLDAFNYKNYKQTLAVSTSKKVLPERVIKNRGVLRLKSVRWSKYYPKQAFRRLRPFGTNRFNFRKYKEIEPSYVRMECPSCRNFDSYFTVEETKPHYEKSLPVFDDYSVGNRSWNEKITPDSNSLVNVSHITDLDGFIVDRVFWFECTQKKCFSVIKVTASEISSMIQQANINRNATWVWAASCIGHAVYDPIIKADGTRFFFQHGFKEVSQKMNSGFGKKAKNRFWDDGLVGPVSARSRRQLGLFLSSTNSADVSLVNSIPYNKQGIRMKPLQYSFLPPTSIKDFRLWSWPAFIAYFPPIENYVHLTATYGRGVPVHPMRTADGYLNNMEHDTLLKNYGSGLHYTAATLANSNENFANTETAYANTAVRSETYSIAERDNGGVSYGLIAGDSLRIALQKAPELCTANNNMRVNSAAAGKKPSVKSIVESSMSLVSSQVYKSRYNNSELEDTLEYKTQSDRPGTKKDQQSLSTRSLTQKKVIKAKHAHEPRYDAAQLSTLSKVGIIKYNFELSAGCLNYVLNSQNYQNIVYNSAQYNKYFNSTVWKHLFSKTELMDKESTNIMNNSAFANSQGPMPLSRKTLNNLETVNYLNRCGEAFVDIDDIIAINKMLWRPYDTVLPPGCADLQRAYSFTMPEGAELEKPSPVVHYYHTPDSVHAVCSNTMNYKLKEFGLWESRMQSRQPFLLFSKNTFPKIDHKPGLLSTLTGVDYGFIELDFPKLKQKMDIVQEASDVFEYYSNINSKFTNSKSIDVYKEFYLKKDTDYETNFKKLGNIYPTQLDSSTVDGRGFVFTHDTGFDKIYKTSVNNKLFNEKLLPLFTISSSKGVGDSLGSAIKDGVIFNIPATPVTLGLTPYSVMRYGFNSYMQTAADILANETYNTTGAVPSAFLKNTYDTVCTTNPNLNAINMLIGDSQRGDTDFPQINSNNWGMLVKYEEYNKPTGVYLNSLVGKHFLATLSNEFPALHTSMGSKTILDTLTAEKSVFNLTAQSALFSSERYTTNMDRYPLGYNSRMLPNHESSRLLFRDESSVWETPSSAYETSGETLLVPANDTFGGWYTGIRDPHKTGSIPENQAISAREHRGFYGGRIFWDENFDFINKNISSIETTQSAQIKREHLRSTIMYPYNSKRFVDVKSSLYRELVLEPFNKSNATLFSQELAGFKGSWEQYLWRNRFSDLFRKLVVDPTRKSIYKMLFDVSLLPEYTASPNNNGISTLTSMFYTENSVRKMPPTVTTLSVRALDTIVTNKLFYDGPYTSSIVFNSMGGSRTPDMSVALPFCEEYQKKSFVTKGRTTSGSVNLAALSTSFGITNTGFLAGKYTTALFYPDIYDYNRGLTESVSDEAEMLRNECQMGVTWFGTTLLELPTSNFIVKDLVAPSSNSFNKKWGKVIVSNKFLPLFFGDSTVYDFTSDLGTNASILQLQNNMSTGIGKELAFIETQYYTDNEVYDYITAVGLLSPFLQKNYKLYGLKAENMTAFDAMARLFGFSDLSGQYLASSGAKKDLYAGKYEKNQIAAVHNIFDNYNPYSCWYPEAVDKAGCSQAEVLTKHNKSIVDPLLHTTLFDPQKAIAPFAPIFNKTLYKSSAPYLWYDYDRMIHDYETSKKKIINNIFNDTIVFSENVLIKKNGMKEYQNITLSNTLSDQPMIESAVNKIKPWVNALATLDALHHKFEIAYLEKQGLRGPRYLSKKIQTSNSIFVSTVENSIGDYQRNCENSSRLVVQAFLSTLIFGHMDKESGLFISNNIDSWFTRSDSTLETHLNNVAIALNLKQVLSPEAITYQDEQARDLLAPAFLDATCSGKAYFMLVDWYLKAVSKQGTPNLFNADEEDELCANLNDLPAPLSPRILESGAAQTVDAIQDIMALKDTVLVNNCLKAVANLAAYEHMLLTKDFVCILSLLKQIMHRDATELCQFTYKNSVAGSTCKVLVDPNVNSAESHSSSVAFTENKRLLFLNVDLLGSSKLDKHTANKPIISMISNDAKLNTKLKYINEWFSSKIEISMKPEDARNYINYARHNENVLANPSRLFSSLTKNTNFSKNAVDLVRRLGVGIRLEDSSKVTSVLASFKNEIAENFFSTENLHVLDRINPNTNPADFVRALLVTLYINNNKTSFTKAHSNFNHQLIANNPVFNTPSFVADYNVEFIKVYSFAQFLDFAGFLCFGEDWATEQPAIFEDGLDIAKEVSEPQSPQQRPGERPIAFLIRRMRELQERAVQSKNAELRAQAFAHKLSTEPTSGPSKELFKQLLRLYSMQGGYGSSTEAAKIVFEDAGSLQRYVDFSFFAENDSRAVLLQEQQSDRVVGSNQVLKNVIEEYLADVTNSDVENLVHDNLLLALTYALNRNDSLGKFSPFISSWNYMFISTLVEKYHLDTINFNEENNLKYMRAIVNCDFVQSRMEYNGFTLFPFANSGATPFPQAERSSPAVNMFISAFDGDVFDVGQREAVWDYILQNKDEAVISKYRLNNAILRAEENNKTRITRNLLELVLESNPLSTEDYLINTSFSPETQSQIEYQIYNIFWAEKPLRSLKAQVWRSATVSAFWSQIFNRFHRTYLTSEAMQLPRVMTYGMNTDTNSLEFKQRMSSISRDFFNRYLVQSRLDESGVTGQDRFTLLRGSYNNKPQKGFKTVNSLIPYITNNSNKNRVPTPGQLRSELVASNKKVLKINKQQRVLGPNKRYMLDDTQLYRDLRSFAFKRNKAAKYLRTVNTRVVNYKLEKKKVYNTWIEAYMAKIYYNKTSVTDASYEQDFSVPEAAESISLNNDTPNWLTTYLKVEAAKSQPDAIRAEVDFVFYNNAQTESKLIQEIVSSSEQFELTRGSKLNSTIALANSMDKVVMPKVQTLSQRIYSGLSQVITKKSSKQPTVAVVKISDNIFVLPKIEYVSKLQKLGRAQALQAKVAKPGIFNSLVESNPYYGSFIDFIKYIRPGFKKAFDPEFIPNSLKMDAADKLITQSSEAYAQKQRILHDDESGATPLPNAKNASSEEYYSAFVSNKEDYVGKYIYLDDNGRFIKEVTELDLKSDLLTNNSNPELYIYLEANTSVLASTSSGEGESQKMFMDIALAPNQYSGIPKDSWNILSNSILDIVRFSNFWTQSMYSSSTFNSNRPCYDYENKPAYGDNRKYTALNMLSRWERNYKHDYAYGTGILSYLGISERVADTLFRETWDDMFGQDLEDLEEGERRLRNMLNNPNVMHCLQGVTPYGDENFMPIFNYLNERDSVSGTNAYDVWSSGIAAHLASLENTSQNELSGILAEEQPGIQSYNKEFVPNSSAYSFTAEPVLDATQAQRDKLAKVFFDNVEHASANKLEALNSWESLMQQTEDPAITRQNLDFNSDFGRFNSIMYRTHVKIQKDSWEAYSNLIERINTFKELRRELNAATNPDIDISYADLHCIVYNQTTLILKDMYVLARTSDVDIKRLSRYFFDEQEHYNLGTDLGRLTALSRNPMDYADMFWPDLKRFSSNFAPKHLGDHSPKYKKAFKS